MKNRIVIDFTDFFVRLPRRGEQWQTPVGKRFSQYVLDDPLASSTTEWVFLVDLSYGSQYLNEIHGLLKRTFQPLTAVTLQYYSKLKPEFAHPFSKTMAIDGEPLSWWDDCMRYSSEHQRWVAQEHGVFHKANLKLFWRANQNYYLISDDGLKALMGGALPGKWVDLQHGSKFKPQEWLDMKRVLTGAPQAPKVGLGSVVRRLESKPGGIATLPTMFASRQSMIKTQKSRRRVSAESNTEAKAPVSPTRR